MIKRILVGLGGTPYASAKIRHAVDLATRFDTDITGVTVVNPNQLVEVGPIPIGGGAAAQELREHREQLSREHLDQSVESFGKACRERDITCHLIREEGDPFDELSALWRYHDLTILGVRGFFEYGVLREPADAVIRLIARGVQPILAVAREYRPIKRVLFACDGSLESASAMKQFAMINLWPEVHGRLICCDKPEDEAKPLLDAAANYCAVHGIETDTVLRPEAASTGLLAEAADWKADMIVMGATKRSLIAKLVLGNTAHHVMQHADVPLFLAH